MPTDDRVSELAAIYNPAANTNRMMTVAQLRELLAGYPDSAVVVLAGDEEGNDFHDLDAENGVGVQWYTTSGPCVGEVTNLDEDDFEPIPGVDVIAVTLWP